MAGSTRTARVNPFDIDRNDHDNDDGWDDWGDEEDYDDYEEQARLVSRSDPYGGPPRRPVVVARDRRKEGGGGGSWSYLAGGIASAVLVLWVFGGSGRGRGVTYQSLNDHQADGTFRLVVLGERHTGASWIADKLRECYPHATVSPTLQREGRWFQDHPSRASEASVSQQQHPRATSTLVVHATLNPYDWLARMREDPRHAPRHTAGKDDRGKPLPLPWRDFLDLPWTLEERPPRDVAYANHTEDHAPCQLGFRYAQVISCRPLGDDTGSNNDDDEDAAHRFWDADDELQRSLDNPIYELQEAAGLHPNTTTQNPNEGTPFASIVDLRAAKLRNHQGVADWEGEMKVVPVRYDEDLAGEAFRVKLLEPIEEWTGWQRSCSSMVLPPAYRAREPLTRAFAEAVAARIDWNAEALVGYAPWGDEELDDLPPETPSPTAYPTPLPTAATPAPTARPTTAAPTTTAPTTAAPVTAPPTDAPSNAPSSAPSKAANTIAEEPPQEEEEATDPDEASDGLVGTNSTNKDDDEDDIDSGSPNEEEEGTKAPATDGEGGSHESATNTTGAEGEEDSIVVDEDPPAVAGNETDTEGEDDDDDQAP